MQKNLIKLYSILAIIIFFIDRVTKYLAFYFLNNNKIINDFFKFKLILNRGISLGLLNSKNPIIFSLVTTSVILITFYLIFYTINKHKTNYLIYGEILVITGSLSNILDRLLYGGVIDFIAINISSLIPVTFFNLSDLSISIGILIMLIQFFKTEMLNKNILK